MINIQYLVCVVVLLTAATSTPVNSSTTVNPRSTTPWRPPSQYWDVNDFPNPRYDVNKCGRRGISSYVCDPNNVLSTADADRIDAAIASVRQNTPCECVNCPAGRGGFMMAVAVVPWLKLPPGVPRTDGEVQLTIEHFAVELTNKRWSFGYCKNDAVIVLSKNDRRIFTATGRTTNSYLPSGCVDKAASDARNKLKRLKYADAIIQMLYDYKATINNDGVCSYGYVEPWIIAVAVIVPLVCFLSICCGVMKRRATMNGGTGNGFFYGWLAGSTYNSGHHHHHHNHNGGGSSWGGGGGGGGFSSGGGGGGGGTSW